MKVVNARLEYQALKTICEAGPRTANLLLAGLNKESFYNEPTKAAFSSILTSVKTDGEIPSWDQVCTNPQLSEKHRRLLKAAEVEAIDDVRKAKSLTKSLDQLRQLRGMHRMAETVYNQLEGDAVDIDALIESAHNEFMKVRSRTDLAKVLRHTGHKNNTSALVKKLLSPRKLPVIPTGFKTFDDKNGGILLGSLFCVAAPTGVGKSAMVNQLAINFTLTGADVAIVPLEMTEDQMMARKLGVLSGIDVHRITQGTLNREEKQIVKKSYAKYVRTLQESKTRYTIFPPEEDVSIEEVLFTLKPYGYKVIIIDYISLLKDADGDEQWKQLAKISRFAKVFAKNNDCFSGNEKFLTREYGMVPFAEVVNQKVTVLTKNGWEKATVKSFGKKLTQTVTFKPMHWHAGIGKFVKNSKSNLQHVVTCTPSHRWVLTDGSVTKELKVGDSIPSSAVNVNRKSKVYSEGLRHGLIFGDGTDEGFKPEKGHYSMRVSLYGNKAILFKHLFKYFRTPQRDGEVLAIHYTNTSYKKLPESGKHADYIAGFIDGWIATDGHTDKNDSTWVSSQNSAALEWLVENAPIGGYVATGQRYSTNMDTNYGRRNAKLGYVTLKTADRVAWVVDTIKSSRAAKVYCAVVPKAQAFTLANGLYTGNCIVVLVAQLSKDGLVRYSGGIAENCIIGDSLVLTDKGLKSIQSIFGSVPTHVQSKPVHGLKAKTFGGFENISHVHFNGYRDTFKVTLACGRSITGTDNHPLFVVDDKSLRERVIGDLTVGDLVSVHTNAEISAVISVESAGVQPVFDLTVENEHVYVANEFYVHNCNNLWAMTGSGEMSDVTLLDVDQQKARNQLKFPFQLMSINKPMQIKDVDESMLGNSDEEADSEPSEKRKSSKYGKSGSNSKFDKRKSGTGGPKHRKTSKQDEEYLGDLNEDEDEGDE